MSSFSVGSVISFSYPRHNYAGCRRSYESRRLLIQAVRDTAEKPLDSITPTLNPNLNRGRVLVKGIDLDKQAERSFYVERMEDLKVVPKEGSYCVAVIAPPVVHHVRDVRDMDVSLEFAEAQISLLEMNEPDEEFLALPIRSIQ